MPVRRLKPPVPKLPHFVRWLMPTPEPDTFYDAPRPRETRRWNWKPTMAAL